MRQLKNPLEVYYVAPTGRKTLWTKFLYFDGQHFFDHLGAALLLADAREIKAGKRPWLEMRGDIPGGNT